MNSVYEPHLKFIDENKPIGCNILQCFENGRIHFHDTLEILYFLEGDCCIINGNDELQVETGDIIVFNSGDIHCVNRGKKVAKYIILQISYSFCESVGFRYWEYTFKKQFCDKKIADMLIDILEENNAENDFFIESIKVKVLNLLLDLFKNYTVDNQQNSTYNSKLRLTKKIIKYIQTNISEPITIKDIANYYGYTRFHISRVFKEATGTTVLDYISFVKVEEAKKLLKKSDESIAEIAVKCGFSSQGYFCKIFKKYENISPNEYKKQVYRK